MLISSVLISAQILVASRFKPLALLHLAYDESMDPLLFGIIEADFDSLYLKATRDGLKDVVQSLLLNNRVSDEAIRVAKKLQQKKKQSYKHLPIAMQDHLAVSTSDDLNYDTFNTFTKW